MLRFWMSFAAAVLVVSLLAHASTFFGSDPMEAIPGVMFIHVLIFPPFIAAIVYMNRVGGSGKTTQQDCFKLAPRWLNVLLGIFFAYAFLNFGLFIFLTGGGTARQEGAKFVMKSHGRVLREIDEKEFHRQQAYVVRGFSGHWMLFATAALTGLWGTHRMRALKESVAAKEATFSNPPA
jgi:hypothetical protein